MKLQDIERRKFQIWLDGNQPACQFCTEGRFIVYPRTMRLPEFASDADETESVADLELAVAICKKCGQIAYFSRRALKVVYNSDSADDVFLASLFDDE